MYLPQPPASLVAPGDAALPLHVVSTGEVARWRQGQSQQVRDWLDATAPWQRAGTALWLPDASGAVAAALALVGDDPGPLDFAGLPGLLAGATMPLVPVGVAAGELAPARARMLALGWAIGSYRFSRYRQPRDPRPPARLVWPSAEIEAAVAPLAAVDHYVRSLIDTPAEECGPEQLASAAVLLAEAFAATVTIVEGDALLAAGYPLVHAVGRASARAPRLIDLIWGEPDAPRVTLVGKGVCFDSGGLQVKPGDGMKLMKKDMGGAAHALGLAWLIMRAGLKLRLRLLLPAVDNAISGNAFRPKDVFRSRSGKTVSIGHTDAEGRLILADALTAAGEDQPELLLDFATLTGAARTALGPDLPALFVRGEALAEDWLAAARQERDPLWRLPLWQGYRGELDDELADLNSTGKSQFAGAIIAALFLDQFAGQAASWAHLDLYAWNANSRPGFPAGAAMQGVRGAFAMLARRYPA